MVVNLTLKSGKKLELSVDEMRELHEQLGVLLQVNKSPPPPLMYDPGVPWWHPNSPNRVTS